jgi:hypothetical protein
MRTKSCSYGSVGHKVAGEGGAFEFVHLWEVEVKFVELGRDFAPEAGLVRLETFSDIASVGSRIGYDVGVEFSRERTSVAPVQENRVKDAHTEEVHSA